MFCAARGAVRKCEANQKRAAKKTVPAKNSEANFWRLRFTRPLRAGKRANANFACSEGFFLSGAPRRLPGLAAFSKPAAVWPVGFCAWCFGVFSVGVPLPCSRPVGCPPFFVWPALPACRLAVVGFVSGLQAACRFCANFCAHCLVCPPCALCAHFRLVLAVCSPVLCCVRGFSLLSFAFFCLTSFSQTSFHLSLRPRRALPRLSPPAALFPACGSCYLLLFRGLLRPLPVCLFCVVYAGFLSFVFHLFLPNFFLSKLFSFVAQAATGISLLVPSRGFVSGLRVLSPAAFSRTFAPIACLPVLRCLCELSLVFLPFPA